MLYRKTFARYMAKTTTNQNLAPHRTVSAESVARLDTRKLCVTHKLDRKKKPHGQKKKNKKQSPDLDKKVDNINDNMDDMFESLHFESTGCPRMFYTQKCKI